MFFLAWFYDFCEINCRNKHRIENLQNSWNLWFCLILTPPWDIRVPRFGNSREHSSLLRIFCIVPHGVIPLGIWARNLLRRIHIFSLKSPLLRSILIHFEIKKWWKHWNNKLCVEASHLWPVHLRGIDYAMFDKLGAGRCNWVAAPILSLDNAGIRWLSCCTTTRPLFWRSGSRLLHVCCGYFGAFLDLFGSRDELAIVWEWAGSLSSQPRDLRLPFGYNLIEPWTWLQGSSCLSSGAIWNVWVLCLPMLATSERHWPGGWNAVKHSETERCWAEVVLGFPGLQESQHEISVQELLWKSKRWNGKRSCPKRVAWRFPFFVLNESRLIETYSHIRDMSLYEIGWLPLLLTNPKLSPPSKSILIEPYWTYLNLAGTKLFPCYDR